MIGVHRLTCLAAALILVFSLAPVPAKAQFAPRGGANGGMMTQMAPMLETMKAKMGKRRFATMMQTMGPMVSKMMEDGGIPAGLGGGTGFVADGYGTDMGSGDIMGMLGGSGGSEVMSMIPQLMQMANFGGGYGRRHHRRRS